MDSITKDESEAFYKRDFVIGDSDGLLSELNESEGEEEEVDEPSLTYAPLIKKENNHNNSDSALLHPKIKREPDTQLLSQPTKYARHEPIKREYGIKEEIPTQTLDSTKKSDLDSIDYRDRYLKSPRIESKEHSELSYSYRKRFMRKSHSPVTTVRPRPAYARSPITTTAAAPAALATPTDYQYSPSSTLSDFYQLPIREHGNESLERNVSALNITKEDAKKELPTPAREHYSPVHQSSPPRFASPIRTPENIPMNSRNDTAQLPAYRNEIPRPGSSPRSSNNDPNLNNGLAHHNNHSRNGSAAIDFHPPLPPPSPSSMPPPLPPPTHKVESPVHSKSKSYTSSTTNGGAIPKKDVFIAPAIPHKPKPRIDDPFQIPQGSHIPNIPRPGETVTVNKNEYSILRLVGEGASGKVFQVYSHTHSDIFALKWVLIKKEEDRQSILNEIKLLVSLRNETSIVRLYDHCNTPKVIYMIMEYGDVSFQQIIANQANKKWDLTFIRYYWLQMLNAVNTIHEHNIVHSDLKPANFVIVKGYLKLIDFGIAKRVSDDTTNIERDVPVGTVNYMAPEALININEGREDAQLTKQGRASDVWSLGCILYQMVYGKPPFYHLTMHQRVFNIVNKKHKIKFEPTTVHNNCTIEVPAVLSSILRGCLDRDPNMRSPMLELLTHSFVNN